MPTSCRLLPHGAYSLLVAVLTTMGWISALYQDGCNYAKLQGDLSDFNVADDVPYLEVGMNAYRVPKYEANAANYEVTFGRCALYPEHVRTDTAWNAAKAFVFVSLVLGGGATFYLWISTCCRFSRGSWRWAGYEVAAACLIRCLTFVWFLTSMCGSSGRTCSLFYGAKADIMAAAFWFVAAALIFLYYPTPIEVDSDGIIISTSTGSAASTKSAERHRHEQQLSDGDDEEMAAGQDSKQGGNDAKHTTEVKLT
jgi:hypothetical protein